MNNLLLIPIVSFILFILLSAIVQIRDQSTNLVSFMMRLSFKVGFFSLLGLFLFSVVSESYSLNLLYTIPIFFFLICIFFFSGADKAGAGAPAAVILALKAFIIGFITLVGLFFYL